MKSSINVSKENNKENESAKPNPILESLKSDYFLQKLYDIMPKKKKLEIVKYNKKVQNRLDLGVKDYKEYSETYSSIEIEIIPNKVTYGIKFININESDKLYYHIYFNDNKEENVTKIKIIIDNQVNSLEKLFENCDCNKFIFLKDFIGIILII